jgi:hypothetical protein
MDPIFSPSDSGPRRGISLSVFACVAVSLLAGCAPGTLSNMWRDTSFQSTIKNTLIIAVRKDPIRRRLWEDGFAVELNKHGVTATPSYRLFPDAVPDTVQVLDAIRANGYDGVLVTRRLGVDTISSYVPGYAKKQLVTGYDTLRNAYYAYYREVTDSGYTETQLMAHHQVYVWTTVEGGRLVWAGTGDVEEQGSGESVNHAIANLIVPELARQGIIPKKH